MYNPSTFLKVFLLAILCIGQIAMAQEPVQYGTPFTGVPDPQDAVIYQVNMRSFSPGRDIQGVISRLDYIRDLGVNVVYLLPTYPIGSLNSINSPYCIKDYLSVNPELGTLDDLRDLIDEAHLRGMAVILDWVANHTSWDHNWISSHPEWYEQDESGNILSPSLGWTDVAQLNFSNSDMREDMIEAMRYWVYTANCDGFRFDYADGPGADFWKQAIDSLRNIKSHHLLLLAESGKSEHFESGFDFTFGFGLWGKMKDIFRSNANVAGIDAILSGEYSGASDSQRVTHYTSNHDVNSEGTPLDWFGGKTGSMAAFLASAYLKGIPFVYNGQEVGYPDPVYFLNTSSLIDWSLNPDMLEEYKNILAFYKSSPALKNGTLTSHHTADVCAFEKVFQNDTVFVLANLRNSSKSFSFPEGYANKRLYDAYTNETLVLGSNISLSAFEYRVFADSGAVIPVSQLTLSSDYETIAAGESKQLFATIKPLDATYKSVTWYSSDTSLAMVNTMGVVTGISPGTVLIIGKNADQADTCEFMITGIPVTGIDILPEHDTVVGGYSIQPVYIIQPENASNKNISWRSGKPSIASVDQSGTVKGLTSGSAYIYVETEDGHKKDSCEIVVIPGNEFSVYFSKPANWATSIKIYFWDPLPAGILPVVYWPGVDMALSDGWYTYTFTNVSFTNLIFNDRSRQTGNLVRNKDGWYKNDRWYDTNPDAVSIGEKSPDRFNIYPNPVEDGRITVDINQGETGALLKIADMQGRIVFETNLSEERTSLNLSLPKNCMYLLSVSTGSWTHHQTLFVN